jgi:transglutaminase-like putative cysteine protease
VIGSITMSMDPYLRATEVVDWTDTAVRDQASQLRVTGDPVATARACFEFVRDHVQHSRDHERDPATWRASDVLKFGTGYCYAKSHLLAALLRANSIPAGFCYQRLSLDDHGPPYSLHGFNAVHLPDLGWYRVDARGNKPGVDARFAPPRPHLAFRLQTAGEFEFDNVLADPLDIVVSALRASTGWRDALGRLPDVAPDQFTSFGLVIHASGDPMRHFAP